MFQQSFCFFSAVEMNHPQRDSIWAYRVKQAKNQINKACKQEEEVKGIETFEAWREEKTLKNAEIFRSKKAIATRIRVEPSYAAQN